MIERVCNSRRQLSEHGPAALVGMLVPAVGFLIGLFILADDSRYLWLREPSRYPWQLWIVAIFGTLATLAGVVDYRIHRSGVTVVGRGEHQAHVAALTGGGIPLFGLLAVASVIPRPGLLFIPVLIALIATVILICYDEFLYHRRCGRGEILAHRVLTLGNGIAFLAWAHWCFAKGVDNG